MKKTTCLFSLFFILAIISLTIIFYIHSNKDKTTAYNPLKPNKDQKSIASDIFENCHEIKNFVNKLPNNKYGIDYLKLKGKDFSHDSSFTKLEKVALNNDDCGAKASTFLSNFYLNIGQPEKANINHKRTVEFANKNNFAAITNLCGGYDTLTTYNQKFHYCQIIMTDNNFQAYDEIIQFAATRLLSKEYYENNQSEKLIELYEKNKFKNILISMSDVPYSVANLAHKFYEEKDFEKALDLYKKITRYDMSGLTEFIIAYMYEHGEGTSVDFDDAIYWYKQSINKNKNPKFVSMLMNNLALVYEKQLKFVEAFNYYKKAALLDLPLAQFNLGRLYVLGYGTIQDIKEGYAWISIAIAQGLDEISNQNAAEDIKNRLLYALQSDKTGESLKQAESLSQQYYKKYVLHEQLKKESKKENLSGRINEALNIITGKKKLMMSNVDGVRHH